MLWGVDDVVGGLGLRLGAQAVSQTSQLFFPFCLFFHHHCIALRFSGGPGSKNGPVDEEADTMEAALRALETGDMNDDDDEGVRLWACRVSCVVVTWHPMDDS